VVEPLNRVHLGKSACRGAAQPSRNHVFGCKNMYIGDSLVIAASLGVNPSLTICALTERAFIPPEALAKWDHSPEVPTS